MTPSPFRGLLFAGPKHSPENARRILAWLEREGAHVDAEGKRAELVKTYEKAGYLTPQDAAKLLATPPTQKGP